MGLWDTLRAHVLDVALADGARGEDEDAFLRQIAPLLGIDDQDSALARQRVEGRGA